MIRSHVPMERLLRNTSQLISAVISQADVERSVVGAGDTVGVAVGIPVGVEGAAGVPPLDLTHTGFP
jgi:hypothetical protein